MILNAAILLAGVFLVVLAAAVPLGLYMSALFSGELAARLAWMRRVEAAVLKPFGEAGRRPMTWHEYSLSLIALTIAGTIFAYAVLRLQGVLPGNPLGLPGLSPALAFNAAISFSTSTTWQAFGCESALSLLSQAAGMTVLAFLSSAIGIVAAFAFARGLVQSRSPFLGNAWEDLVRCIFWLMLPLAFALALLFVSQGGVQSWQAVIPLQTLEGAAQRIATGPMASQEAVRLLTVTGGSFFSANAAHPFTTPSAFMCIAQVIVTLLM